MTEEISGELSLLTRENDSGQLQLQDYLIKYRVKNRNRLGEAQEVAIEVEDQEGYRVELFILPLADGIDIIYD